MFDTISKDDMILAFFPCVRFEDQAKMWFQGTSHSLAKYSLRRKLEIDLKFHDELHQLYGLVTKLVIVCVDRGLKLVIENPYSVQHYLTNYWALKPAVIEHDRSAKGDYFKKPTQFFFVNCEPKNNFIFEPQVHNVRLRVVTISKNQAYKSVGSNNVKTARSMIAPEYANRFIREFLIDERT